MGRTKADNMPKRKRLLDLWRKGNISKAAAAEDVDVRWSVVDKWFTRFANGDESCEDAPRSGAPKKLTRADYKPAYDHLRNAQCPSYQRACELVNQRLPAEKQICVNTLRRNLFGNRETPYVYAEQPVERISARNIVKRREATTPQKAAELKKKLSHIIFVDATTMRWRKDYLQPHRHQKKLHKKGTTRKAQPLKILYVYGAICMGRNGEGCKSKLIGVPAKKDAAYIIDTVIPELLKFKQDVYKDENVEWVFDGAKEHTAIATATVMALEGITLYEHPPQSPDLNPIELAWALFKNRCPTTRKPRTRQRAFEVIGELWKNLIKGEDITRIIRGLPDRMRAVHQTPGVHASWDAAPAARPAPVASRPRRARR